MICATFILLVAIVSAGLAQETVLPDGLVLSKPDGFEGLVAVPVKQGLTTEEKLHIVTRSNQHRSQVRDPTACDMVEFQWNDEIAQSAQDWANQCIFEHNSAEERRTEEWEWVGQNLAMGYGHTLTTYMDMWFNEYRFYDYNTNDCARGRQCGHYTQVAWADSEYIGCGWARCQDPAQPLQAFDIFACHYGPGGNYIGRWPYKAGDHCTKCPYYCKPGCADGLCKMV